jgi:hypothetical protein
MAENIHDILNSLEGDSESQESYIAKHERIGAILLEKISVESLINEISLLSMDVVDVAECDDYCILDEH